MEQPCLFCFESVEEKDKMNNPIGCLCKIAAHKLCFDQWFQQKQQMECPICHCISIPNPINLETIRVVYIDTTSMREREDIYSRNQKAVGFCCCFLLGWAIGLSILNAVYFH